MYNCDMREVCRECDHNRPIDFGIRSGYKCDLITEKTNINTCYLPVIVDLQKQIIEKDNALEESVKLQSHYAGLLNQYDNGERKQFSTAKEWIDRLNSLKSEKGEENV